jgi:hypothetical protein
MKLKSNANFPKQYLPQAIISHSVEGMFNSKKSQDAKILSVGC